MSETKFCKDCKNIRRDGRYSYSKCAALDQHVINNISGKRDLVNYKYCSDTREIYGACGPEAKLFQKKPRPWYAFWKTA